MQRAWDIELIFPIKDAASAALMVIKADCLHNAGVISDGERQWVQSRARPFLADGTLKRRGLIAPGKVPTPDARRRTASGILVTRLNRHLYRLFVDLISVRVTQSKRCSL